MLSEGLQLCNTGEAVRLARCATLHLGAAHAPAAAGVCVAAELPPGTHMSEIPLVTRTVNRSPYFTRLRPMLTV